MHMHESKLALLINPVVCLVETFKHKLAPSSTLRIRRCLWTAAFSQKFHVPNDRIHINVNLNYPADLLRQRRSSITGFPVFCDSARGPPRKRAQKTMCDRKMAADINIPTPQNEMKKGAL